MALSRTAPQGNPTATVLRFTGLDWQAAPAFRHHIRYPWMTIPNHLGRVFPHFSPREVCPHSNTKSIYRDGQCPSPAVDTLAMSTSLRQHNTTIDLTRSSWKSPRLAKSVRMSYIREWAYCLDVVGHGAMRDSQCQSRV